MQYSTSIDYFLKNKIKVIQYSNGYRSGIDSILLASLLISKAQDNILDLGSGVGVIALSLLARLKNINLYALEKNNLFFELLLQNKQLNEQLIINNNNLFLPFLGNLINWQGNVLFNHIICNPPYFKVNSTKSTSKYSNIRDCANIQEDATIQDFINFMFKNLKNNGKAYLIYPANNLQEIIQLFCSKHWGGIEVFPIYSYQNSICKRFMIVAKKNSKANSVLHSGIIVHNNLNYSLHAKSILEDNKDFFSFYSKQSGC